MLSSHLMRLTLPLRRRSSRETESSRERRLRQGVGSVEAASEEAREVGSEAITEVGSSHVGSSEAASEEGSRERNRRLRHLLGSSPSSH